jgi:hypothetical protein
VSNIDSSVLKRLTRVLQTQSSSVYRDYQGRFAGLFFLNLPSSETPHDYAAAPNDTTPRVLLLEIGLEDSWNVLLLRML